MPQFNFGAGSLPVAWIDVSCTVGGSKVSLFKKIKYKSTIDKKPVMVEGNKPVAINPGDRTYDGTLGLLEGHVNTLNAAAVSAGGDDLLDLELDITVTYKAKGSRKVCVDTLVGVQFTSYEKGMERGATEMPIDLPFIYLDQLSNNGQ